MIVTKENERLYLRNWEYNACRIISTLATIIENEGGSIKPQKPALISNRTLDAAKRDLILKIEKLETVQKETPNEKRALYIKARYAELEKMEAVKNEPIAVSHTTYISFTHNNDFYYYQVSDNPFFEFYYQKTHIKNGMYSRDAALVEDPKEWLFDCFLSWGVSNEDIKEAAQLIFNMLVAAKHTPIMRDKKRRRVSNVYNNGYHYETIYSPEKFEKIDF